MAWFLFLISQCFSSFLELTGSISPSLGQPLCITFSLKEFLSRHLIYLTWYKIALVSRICICNVSRERTLFIFRVSKKGLILFLKHRLLQGSCRSRGRISVQLKLQEFYSWHQWNYGLISDFQFGSLQASVCA